MRLGLLTTCCDASAPPAQRNQARAWLLVSYSTLAISKRAGVVAHRGVELQNSVYKRRFFDKITTTTDAAADRAASADTASEKRPARTCRGPAVAFQERRRVPRARRPREGARTRLPPSASRARRAPRRRPDPPAPAFGATAPDPPRQPLINPRVLTRRPPCLRRLAAGESTRAARRTRLADPDFYETPAQRAPVETGTRAPAATSS